jgi:hypothetical protein
MRTGLILGVLLAAGAATAQDVATGRQAAAMLFGADTEGIIIGQPALPQPVIDAIRTEAGRQKYYGAMAWSPSEGIAAPSALMVANLHDLVAAETVALKACNDARAGGSAPCEVIAHIRPDGYEPRDVQLNADATRGFRVYRQGGGPKALAISRATGEWHFEKGEGAEAAALAGCNRLAVRKGVEDCMILVSDP